MCDLNSANAEKLMKTTRFLMFKGIGGVTASFTSSNNAKVDSNGKITAVGTGKVVITTTLKLYSGRTRTVKTTITVK